MTDPVLARRPGRLRCRLDNDFRNRRSLLDILLFLLASGVVFHVETGDGIVQTTVLSIAGFFLAGEPALKPLDGFKRSRALDFLPLLRLAARDRSLALGRLEDLRQRLHLAPHLREHLVGGFPRARRQTLAVAQSARQRARRRRCRGRRLRRAADGKGVAGEFLGTIGRVTFR